MACYQADQTEKFIFDSIFKRVDTWPVADRSNEGVVKILCWDSTPRATYHTSLMYTNNIDHGFMMSLVETTVDLTPCNSLMLINMTDDVLHAVFKPKSRYEMIILRNCTITRPLPPMYAALVLLYDCDVEEFPTCFCTAEL